MIFLVRVQLADDWLPVCARKLTRDGYRERLDTRYEKS